MLQWILCLCFLSFRRASCLEDFKPLIPINQTRSFRTWNELMEHESACLSCNTITCIVFAEINAVMGRCTTRVTETCPYAYRDMELIDFDTQPISAGWTSWPPKGWQGLPHVDMRQMPRVDINSTQLMAGFTWLLTPLFSNPRYKENSFRVNRMNMVRYANELEWYVRKQMEFLEERLAATVLISKYAKRCSNSIPFILTDYSGLVDFSPSRVRLFYGMFRAMLNSYKSKHGFQFFVPPRYGQHISGKQKTIGDFLGTNFKEASAGDLDILYLFMGKEACGVVATVADTASRAIEVQSLNLKTFPLLSLGLKDVEVIAAPFTHLGLFHSSVLLLKRFCQTQSVNGVCEYPCLPKGWVQECHTGILAINPEEAGSRWNFEQWASYRVARYCRKYRKDNKELSRQRGLCEDFLGYDVHNSFVPERAAIRNCSIIIGTGDTDQCRTIIREYVLNSPLPLYEEAQAAGIPSLSGIGRILDNVPAKVQVDGMGYRYIRYLMSAFPEVFGGHSLEVGIPLAKFEMLVNIACDTPLGSFDAEVARALMKEAPCFNQALGIEVLLAVGAGPETLVVHKNWRELFPQGGLESDPAWFHDNVDLGEAHWKHLSDDWENVVKSFAEKGAKSYKQAEVDARTS